MALYEERLRNICNTPVMDALDKAVTYLSDTEKMSRDQAAVEVIETICDLDSVWREYMVVEGIHKLKKLLRPIPPS